VLLALAGLAGAAGLIVLARHAPPFREVSDGAVLEIYTLEALRGRLLVGPYSRFGWHHPGPLYFYLEAPWYWASGLHTAGVQAGAIAINLTAAAVATWALVASTRASIAVPVCVSMAWYTFRASDVLASAWNPHVIVLPLVAFVVVASTFCAAGGLSSLLWTIVLGSFVVQTHLGTAPVVAVLGLIAIAVRWRTIAVHWIAAGCVALFLWFPPLLDEVIHRPGNLTLIVDFFGHTAGGQPLARAAAAWGSMSAGVVRPGFVVATGVLLRSAARWPFVFAAAEVAALLAIGLLACRQHRPLAWLATMSAAASLVALAATTRIHDQIIDHEIFWMSALGALNIGVIVGAAIGAFGRADQSDARLTRIAAACAWLVIAALCLNEMRLVLNRPRTIDDHAVDLMTDEIETYTRSRNVTRPLFAIDQPMWEIAAGALLRVDKAGGSFAVDQQWVTMFGDRFRETGREDGKATLGGSKAAPQLTTP
jgi:hypothetical protein